MTLDDIYVNYRDWAIRSVEAWIKSSGFRDLSAAEDIVQEAFFSLWSSSIEIRHPAALVNKACRQRFLDWAKAAGSQKRDDRRTTSFDAMAAANHRFGAACGWANTEASVLAAEEISEKLGVLTPAYRKALLQWTLRPTDSRKDSLKNMASKAKKMIEARTVAA